MSKQKEKIKKQKKRILDKLEGIKEFELTYWEEVCHSKKFKAKSKEELKKKFNDGELELDDKDIIDGNMIEDSLEIEEVE